MTRKGFDGRKGEEEKRKKERGRKSLEEMRGKRTNWVYMGGVKWAVFVSVA